MANTLEEGLLSGEAQSGEAQTSNMEILQECLSPGAGEPDVWWFGGQNVNNDIESSDYTNIWLYRLDKAYRNRQSCMNPLMRKQKVMTGSRDKHDIILDRCSMWQYLDVPLDVPLTEEDVENYRQDQRWKADQSFRECQTKIFNKEFLAMTEQFPDVALGQISLPKTMTLGDFHLKTAKAVSSLCLTAKEPLSNGYFNKIPMVINEKILTYLTGLGALHTRVIWISMRSDLNKYDRAYIKDANPARAEASFLDRVAMNLFEQLNNRAKQEQFNEGYDVIFEEWRKNFFESVRLKRERRQSLNKLKPSQKMQKLRSSVAGGGIKLSEDSL